MLYDAFPSKDVHTCEQLADLFTVFHVSRAATRQASYHARTAVNHVARLTLQDPRDFVDVLTPQLPVLFKFLMYRSVYLQFVRHLILGETGTCQPPLTPA